MNAHEIDYQIVGSEMQYVEIELDPGRASSRKPAA
ncbi:AIM24 family protein [Paenibacillus sp. P25]|nr:AIM24 family protein [Paenibacillus sp. P25]